MKESDVQFFIIIILLACISFMFLNNHYYCTIKRELPAFDLNETVFNYTNFSFEKYYTKYEIYEMFKRGELKGTDNNISCNIYFKIRSS